MTYMTAEELGISEEERSGLIQLIDHLRGEVCMIPHSEARVTSPGGYLANTDLLKDTIIGFSMLRGAAVVARNEPKFDCGCVACIGGHLSLIMQGVDIKQRAFPVEKLMTADRYVMDFKGSDHPIVDLFYPDNAIIHGEHWHEITPAIAAEAIVNFLTGAAADWKSLRKRFDLTPAPIEGSEGFDEYEREFI